MRELDDLARDLFAAVPGLAAAMSELGDDPVPDADAPTLWLGDVGRAIAARASDLSAEQLAAAFAVIERHLAKSGQRMGTAITTGLLESLAHAVSRGDLDPGVLASRLGPESRAYVDAYDQFTLGRSSLDPS